jgi:hypothetical protein
MSFVFPVALGGLALVSVPILVHLIMRQKPKHLLFPAFRFLLQRHRTHLRKLRLRHLLLLAMRILLVALIILALTRPKFFNERLNLSTERPVAAVLLFDTSLSMEYTVDDKGHERTRLADARRHAADLLKEFPPGSKVAVLDTAQASKDWLSVADALQKVKDLRTRPDNFSVTYRLQEAYALLDKMSRDPDEVNRGLPRFLYVFSDRTQGCWEPALVKKRQEEADRIPPPADRLAKLPERLGPLLDLVGPLQDRLGVPGGPALAQSLRQLRDYQPAGDGLDYPDALAFKALSDARGQCREILRRLAQRGDKVPKKFQDYRDQVRDRLQTFLQDFKGVYEVFVDVGVKKPTDLAITDLEWPEQLDRDVPRQVFTPDETVLLRVKVQATGEDFDSFLEYWIDRDQSPRKPAVKLKAGTSKVIPLEIDCSKLRQGLHQVVIRVNSEDRLKFNNFRFGTFLIREGRRVLVVADPPDTQEMKELQQEIDEQLRDMRAKGKTAAEMDRRRTNLTRAAHQADLWVRAVNATGEFACRREGKEKDLVTPEEFARYALKDLLKYNAVCLFGVARPSKDVWELLAKYVRQGGGLAVMPGGARWRQKVRLEAYNSGPAQDLMPGKLKGVVKSAAGVPFDWQPGVYRHALLQPFEKWNTNPNIDFVEARRRAYRYWRVEAPAENVLLRYRDKGRNPALLETHFDKGKGGKVLLFTSPLTDQRKLADKEKWNNYTELLNTFTVVWPHLTLRYLAGDAAPVRLNFLSGEPVDVRLPLGRQSPPFSVEGPALEDADSTLEAEKGTNRLRVRGAVHGGNYPVYDKDRRRVAAFSVNVPPAECDLTRVPPEQITALFGPRGVMPLADDAKLLDALREHWAQPVELLPAILLAVLFFLVAESLFANKFYRRDPDDPAVQAGAERGHQ